MSLHRRAKPSLLTRPTVLFLVLLIAGAGVRIGYGVARFRDAAIYARGEEFVRLWDYDALEHLLIAEAIRAGKGYIVLPPPQDVVKHVRAVGKVALFKAPLYEYLLAGLFWVSGPSFGLLLMVQAVAGG
ncbi:MAG: hypothetical protein ACREMY_18325, partial [bacterium]